MKDTLYFVLDKINAKAPYIVGYDDQNMEALVFCTSQGVKYTISFPAENSVFCEYLVYQIYLSPDGNAGLGDKKIGETVTAIIETFFENNNNRAIIYYCDAGDSRQISRNRLFNIWLSNANKDNRFIQTSGVIKTENLHHYGAIICLRDNPNKDEIMCLFNSFIGELEK